MMQDFRVSMQVNLIPDGPITVTYALRAIDVTTALVRAGVRLARAYGKDGEVTSASVRLWTPPVRTLEARTEDATERQTEMKFEGGS